MIWKKELRFSGAVIHCVSLAWLMLPALIFAAGWLKPAIGRTCFVLFLMLWAAFYREYRQDKRTVTLQVWYLAVLAGALVVWLALSGIGGIGYQNLDFYVRNPLYADLVQRPWPLTYDLSLQPPAVQEICGSGTVGFVYYFFFWLPPALLARYLGLAQLWLFLWCFAGLSLVLLQLHLYLQKQNLIIPAVFILFSGLDVLPFVLQEGIVKTAHMEWWAGHLFQYSSNTTLLFWVFNQAIPLWLITACLLNQQDNRTTAGLCSLAFLFSPFATFGMVPIAVWSVFRKKQNMLKAITPVNVAVPLLMLGIFGSFYLAKPGGLGANGFIWAVEDPLQVAKWYLPFVLMEAGLYLICLHREMLRYDYLALAAVELLVIPMYKLTDANDFAMRASIPALFILCVAVMRYLLEHRDKFCIALAVLLLLGACTAGTEMLRSVKFTLSPEGTPNLVGDSFGAMVMDRYEYAADLVSTVNDQFFVPDFHDTLFGVYLGK